MVLDCCPKSSYIEVCLVRSSEVSSDHPDFGDEQDDNGPINVNDAMVTTNTNIHNWSINFTDITNELLMQKSGLSLPEN